MMLRPSGDQTGYLSIAGLKVSRVRGPRTTVTDPTGKRQRQVGSRKSSQHSARALLRISTLVLIAAGLFPSEGDPQPAISVSGGIQASSGVQPLVFTWNSSVPVQGS